LAARVAYTGETAEATGTVTPINLGRQFAVIGSGITVAEKAKMQQVLQGCCMGFRPS
jgi:hypothetical protein